MTSGERSSMFSAERYAFRFIYYILLHVVGFKNSSYTHIHQKDTAALRRQIHLFSVPQRVLS